MGFVEMLDGARARIKELEAELKLKDAVVEAARHVDGRLKAEEVPLDILDHDGIPCGDAGELLNEALAALDQAREVK